MNKKFALVQNMAAGSARVLGPDEHRTFHENWISDHETREEAERACSELAGPDVWVVFYDAARGSAFIEKHNRISGNWRGSMHPRATVWGEYETRKEAQEVLDSIRSRK